MSNFLNIIVWFCMANSIVCQPLLCGEGEFLDDELACVMRNIIESEKPAELSEAEEDRIINEKTIIIPVGKLCASTFALREYGLRYVAYPFDWCMTTIEAACNLIVHDFEGLLDEKNMRFISFEHITNVLYSGFDMRHVCPKNVLANDFFYIYWPAVRAKFERRINRFYKAIHSGRKVYFLRCPNFNEHWSDGDRCNNLRLVKAIRDKYPLLDFTFIVVDYDKDFLHDWHVSNVLNFYHRETWHLPDHFLRLYDSLRFKEIFQSMGFLPKA